MIKGCWRTWIVGIMLLPMAAHSRSAQHAVQISNESKQSVVVDWLNMKSGKAVEFHRMREGETIKLNSFANHTFLLRFDNETCTDQICRSTTFVVTDNGDQVVKVNDNLEVEHRDHTNKADFEAVDIVQDCQRIAKESLEAGYGSKVVMKKMLACVEERTAFSIQLINENEIFESDLRTSISSKIEDYSCADEELQTTTAQELRKWMDSVQNVTRQVHILHERKASKIHMIEDFISPEECAAITRAAAPKLHRGTVADGAGGSKLSDHRKAMQAGIRIPWEREEQGNAITRVFRRIYAYTNNATGFGIEVDGQEDLMSIQYFGRGEGDKAPDRYRPHCDGDCNGLPHKRGGRVATMVMYCDTKELVGGGTNFGNSGVFVRPKVGAAAFFSYLDPDTHVHETGFTSHSGCPVVEGTKRIAVHWMRIGVTKEMPWDSFDTNNVHKSECDGEDD